MLAALFLALCPSAPPDVVVFFLDDVGSIDVAEADTPAIDFLASCGTTFTRGYSHPICAPSRATILHSRFIGGRGGATCIPDTRNFPHGKTSMPKIMESAGYATCFLGRYATGGTHLLHQSGDYQYTPHLVGWESARSLVFDGVDSACTQNGTYTNWERVDDGVVAQTAEYNTTAIQEGFVSWWVEKEGEPRFAFVNFMAAHLPFHYPPPSALYLGDVTPPSLFQRTQYLWMIRGADYAISEMLSVVDLNETYVLVLADNGTPSHVPPPGIPASRVKGSVYEPGVRVPFILAGPGVPIGEVSQPVHIVDVVPTLADMAGLASLPDEIQGQSILPALHGEQLERPWAFFGGANVAVVEQRFKLIRFQSGLEQVFDLDSDPAELNPIAPDELPEVADILRGYLTEAQK